MNKSLVWIIAIVVLILGSMFAIRLASNGTGAVESTELTVPVSERDHVIGEGENVLVEYSDFQCPACATYQPALKQLLNDLPGELKLVYRHFPLRQAHLNAQLAAQASEAASLQDKFWEMHDLLFVNQAEWSPVANPTDLFIGYAEELALDVEKFKVDLVSDSVKERVNSDFDSGMQAKVNSTPSFFLNGKKIQNPRSYEELKSIITSAGAAEIDESTAN